jgi:hypothetical protein
MKKLLISGARFDEAKVAALLCRAARNGDLNRVKLMCSNGCSPNAGDHNQRTCLHLAAGGDQIEIAKYLLSLPSIDVNVLDRTGCSPLDDAYRHNSLLCLTLIQNRGGLRGNHSLLDAKSAIFEAALNKKKTEDIRERVNALVQEVVKEHSIKDMVTKNREALLTSIELIEGSHKRVQGRVETWWEHISKNGDADIPLLEGVKHLLKQEPHIRFCIHLVTAVIASIETKLQPVLQTRIPKVLKRGNMEASLKHLRHELELYKQAMTAFKLLKGTSIFAEPKLVLTVNTFLRREASIKRCSVPEFDSDLASERGSRPGSGQASARGSRPVSRQAREYALL